MRKNNEFAAFNGSEVVPYLNELKKDALIMIESCLDEKTLEQAMKFYIRKPIVLLEDKKEQKVDGEDLIISIPYEGDEIFLSMMPTEYILYPPSISKEDKNKIVLTISNFSINNTIEINYIISKKIQLLNILCKGLKKDVDEYSLYLQKILEKRIKELKTVN